VITMLALGMVYASSDMLVTFQLFACHLLFHFTAIEERKLANLLQYFHLFFSVHGSNSGIYLHKTLPVHCAFSNQ